MIKKYEEFVINESIKDKMTGIGGDEMFNQIKPAGITLDQINDSELNNVAKTLNEPLDKLYVVGHKVVRPLTHYFDKILTNNEKDAEIVPCEGDRGGKWYCFPELKFAYRYADSSIVEWVLSEKTFNN